jgi:DNA-binding Xre family transcriptional regulator
MLLEKIREVLKSRNIEFSMLAEHLGIPEDKLSHAFETNTVEIRTLEKISKELKIPLYRFFREPLGNLLESIKENQAYAAITHEELMLLKMHLEVAQREIELLKIELEDRNRYIDELKKKIK